MASVKDISGRLIRSTPLVQQALQCGLAIPENTFQLTANEQAVREFSQNSESGFVFDYVAEDRAVDSITHFGLELMPMVESAKGALFLLVGEVMVPFEFGDAGNPAGAEREKRDDAEGGHQFRAGASKRRLIGYCRFGFLDSRWRDQFHGEQLSPGRGRHDAGQVSWIGEEEEDALDGKRHPLLELEFMGHSARADDENLTTRSARRKPAQRSRTRIPVRRKTMVAAAPRLLLGRCSQPDWQHSRACPQCRR